MSQNADTMTNHEIAKQLTLRLQELRSLATRINELAGILPVGSQLHHGIVLVRREVQGAGEGTHDYR